MHTPDTPPERLTEMEAQGPDVRAGSIAEAVAKAQIHAPTRGNRKLERFLEAVNADERVRTWWYMAQINSERLGMSDHSWVHVQVVLNIALRLMRLLIKGGIQPAMVTDHGMRDHDAEVVDLGVHAPVARERLLSGNHPQDHQRQRGNPDASS